MRASTLLLAPLLLVCLELALPSRALAAPPNTTSAQAPDPQDPPQAATPSSPEPEPAKAPMVVPEPEPAYRPPPPPPYQPPPEEEDDDDGDDVFPKSDHFEMSMGFLAGQRSYSDTSFKYEKGTASGIGGGGLVAPFIKPPFDKTTVLGLRYDIRLVISYVRMTAGFDLPFTTYKASDATAVYDVSGVQRTVTIQSLSPKELRFGLGGEYPFKKVAIYADLLGGVHWIDTSLSIDGYDAEYGAVNFAFSARAGLRVNLRRWFFATASGEIGILGDIRWNAELSVGFMIK